MIRVLLVVTLTLVSLFAQAQPCNPIPTDTLTDGSCTFVPLVPIATAGTPVTKCFVMTPPPGLLTFGYVLIQSPSCGPVAYSYLNYTLYDSTCTNMLASGQILPVATNIGLVVPTPAPTYVVCFTWMPLCDQTAVCPTFGFSPLPVKLLSFQATDAPEGIMLHWRTATERNTDRFEVERSVDLQYWSLVGVEEAAGNSNFTRDYSMLDPEPAEGVNYYRLLQFDLDHQFAMLRIIALGYDRYEGISLLREWNVLGQRK